MENSITYQGNDRVELLKHILESEQKTEISYDEALEVSSSLIHFFEILADENDASES